MLGQDSAIVGANLAARGGLKMFSRQGRDDHTGGSGRFR